MYFFLYTRKSAYIMALYLPMARLFCICGIGCRFLFGVRVGVYSSLWGLSGTGFKLLEIYELRMGLSLTVCSGEILVYV